METEVTYHYRGCGSEKTKIEDTDEPLLNLTKWNLSPDWICRKLGFMPGPIDKDRLKPDD